MTPKPGVVADAVSHDVYPGGSLTAGYDSLLRYMFLVKFHEIAGAIRDKAARLMGEGNGFEDLSRQGLRSILRFELQRYRELSEQYGFDFLLVDPDGAYRSDADAMAAAWGSRFGYVGRDDWRENVDKKVASLAPDQAWVPMDGHYGPGQNKIVGGYLASVLRQRFAEKFGAPTN